MTAPSAPPPIVPAPASGFTTLRGRRVIIGVPGTGFRTDLRADDPIVQGGRTFVPVLTEQDYYRAELEQIEVFVPLVPVDRVWVEHVDTGPSPGIPGRATLDEPPPRFPTAAVDERAILGRRVVHRVPDGFVRDLRAVTPVFVDEHGRESVMLCGEAEWYRWATAGTIAAPIRVDAGQLWVE